MDSIIKGQIDKLEREIGFQCKVVEIKILRFTVTKIKKSIFSINKVEIVAKNGKWTWIKITTENKDSIIKIKIILT